MDKQVHKQHYNFPKYSDKNRWVSYFHQLDETMRLNPASVLEIGVGDKVYGSYLNNNTKVLYKSVDIAEDLNPDVVGSVTALPFNNESFDAVAAFEVLEHLPFEKFEIALIEMARVSKKWILISLPHFGPPIKFLLKIPFFPQLQFAVKIPFYRTHKFNGEHYWEIGKKGYPTSKIKEILTKHLEINKEFVPFENQYHHFFILKKRQSF